jgi:CubicO group peptidase (beta-lactamase class C family)
MRHVTILLLTLLTLACTSAGERIARIERGLLPPTLVEGEPLPATTIDEALRSYEIPGVSIALIENYRIAWTRAYGVREHGSPIAVTPDTLFQVGSISKTVATVGAMRLVEEGALALDEDVNRALTSWRLPENELTRDEKVTLRRLLMHTAGVTISSAGDYFEGEPIPSLAQILDGVPPAKTPPIRVIAVPGSKQMYASSAFFIVQQMMEDVTRQPFATWMREKVLEPLGMRNTTFEQPIPEPYRSRAASGHYPGTTVVRGRWTVKPEMAAAGMWSTAGDVARFAIAVQQMLRGRSRGVLRRETVQQMLASGDAPLSGGERVQHAPRSIGFDVSRDGGVLRFSHGGRTTGYNGTMIAFEDGRGIVILTNGHSQGLAREIIRAVGREYGWSEFQPVVKRAIDVPAAVLAEYAGRYEFPEGRRPPVSVIDVKNGRLHIDGVPLRAESPVKFFSAGEATYTFVRDAAGRVVELIYDAGAFQLTARRLE